MIRSRPWSLLGAVVLVLAAGCDESPQALECQTLCKRLLECRYLPSPLGTGTDPRANCEERCELSATATSNAVRACSGHRSCSTLRQCLALAAGPRILGRGDLKIALSVGRTGTDGCADAGAAPSADAGQQSTGGAQGAGGAQQISSGGQPSWCKATGVLRIRPFVTTLATRFTGDDSDCTESPDGEFIVRDVPAGEVEAVGVELRGVVPGDVSKTEFCSLTTVTGQNVVIPGGTSGPVPVLVGEQSEFSCDVMSASSACPL
jgi:hypothetical protein